MRKLTFWLLWIFVFSVPWEQAFVVFNIGSMSRLIGLLTIAMGLITIPALGQVRRPGVIVCLSFAFTLLSMVSLFWSISPAATAGRVFTYAQLLMVTWLVRELARTRDEQQSLMVAYCLGAYVSIADLVRGFLSGEQIAGGRYSGSNFDPNDFGVTLAIGIPMAWYLFVSRTRLTRVTGAIYVPLAVLAILLTASRGAFLAGLVALSIIPLTLPHRSFGMMTRSAGVLIAALGLAAFVVPESSWNRVLTAVEVVTGGTMNGRVPIWRAGLEVFQQRPVFGAGAGTFEITVEPLTGRFKAPHNVFLAVLVEQGIVGGLVFAALLTACAFCIWRLPALERKVWGIVGLTWLVGGMSLSRQYHKTTWLMFGLIAAQAAVATARRQHSKSRRFLIDPDPSSRGVRIDHIYPPPLVRSSN